MSPSDAATSAANVLLTEIGTFTLTVLAGVIVSLVKLWLAGRQRAQQEQQAESRRREAVLAAIGRCGGTGPHRAANSTPGTPMSLSARYPRSPFDTHAGELATIAPESVATVCEHYGMVDRAREGSSPWGHRAPTRTSRFARTGFDVLEAGVAVSDSATEALRSLGLPVED